MRVRPSSRIVLLDERGRILLFRFLDEAGVIAGGPPVFWATPGGGVEEGESHEAAARRELWEETGIRNAALGPWIWTEDHHLILRGEPTRFYERFYLVRAKSAVIDMANLPTAEERAALSENKWWSLSEIESSREVFYPPGLGELIAPLIVGELPREPILITRAR